MMTETRYLYQRLTPWVDLVLCVAAFFAAHGLRNAVLAPLSGGWVEPSAMRYYLPLLYLFPPLAVLMWHWTGIYGFEHLFYRLRWLRAAVLGLALAMGATALIRFFFGDLRPDPYTGAIVRDSRGQLLSMAALALTFVWTRNELTRRWLAWRRSRGHGASSVLIVGSGDGLRRFLDTVMAHPLWGYRIEGLVSDGRGLSKDDRVRGFPVVATTETLAAYLESKPIDEVFFVPGRTPLDDLAPCLNECETMGVRTRLSLNFLARRINRTTLDVFENVPVVTYHTIQELNGAVMAKWIADRLIAALALVVLSPVLVVIAFAIRQRDKSDRRILFRQRRVGRNGRQFWLYKFRTMRPDAESELDGLREASEVDGPRFKMTDDPRLTAIGKRLRRFSLDELPQLWNVLMGEMSLVGPRPPLPDEVARYTRAQRRRLSVKPGMTCLWAIRGRQNLSWDAIMQADLEYIDNWSLWLDVRILLKTLWVVLRGKGV